MTCCELTSWEIADVVGIELDSIRGDRNRGVRAPGFEGQIDACLLSDNQGDACDLLLGEAGSLGKDAVLTGDEAEHGVVADRGGGDCGLHSGGGIGNDHRGIGDHSAG